MEMGLNLPPFEAKIRELNRSKQIFDPIRKKYVALTPEEWVRQHFINLMVVYKDYPAGLLNVEYPVTINSMQQRVDIVAFNKFGAPVLVVECKAPTVKLTNSTYAQAARYNLTLRANYLMVTNGMSHFCSRVDFETKSISPLKDIPNFREIL